MLCIIFASLISHYLTVPPPSIYLYLLHNTMNVGLKSDLILIRCGWIAGVRVHINSLIEANEKNKMAVNVQTRTNVSIKHYYIITLICTTRCPRLTQCPRPFARVHANYWVRYLGEYILTHYITVYCLYMCKLFIEI